MCEASCGSTLLDPTWGLVIPEVGGVYRAMKNHDFEGTDEEELEHELVRLRAVRKLEAEMNYKETDPKKAFDMGLRFKGGLKGSSLLVLL